jgi:hypothetical protein
MFGGSENGDPHKIQGFVDEARQMTTVEFKDWLAHPWAITMGAAAHSQFFTPLFLFLLPLLFLLGPAGPAAQACWLYFLAVWLFWSATTTQVRLLMPAYPAAAIVIAAALDGPSRRALKNVLALAVLLAAALGLYWAAWLYYSQGLWQPLTGATTRREYLSKTQAAYAYSHYPAIEFVNEKLPHNAKTLIVGDARSYYLRKDFVVSSVFDTTPVVQWATASKDGDELYALMKTQGITHLLLNASEAIRLGRDYRIFPWDARARGVFNNFWNRHLKEVFAQDEMRDGRILNRVAVYELVPTLPPGASPPVNLMEEVVRKNTDAATR